MPKDQFIAQIGFDQVYGDTWFKQAYARNHWATTGDFAMTDEKGSSKRMRAIIGALMTVPSLSRGWS